jgi:hypothetical protein
MNPNQRSKMNNQTDNSANEKWTPGSKGKTADDGPLDHTYPQGAVQQQAGQSGTQQSGMGPGSDAFERADTGGADLPGGSMQSQQTGGSGAVQGITDSHQRQMEQRSGAYGQLEQPTGSSQQQAEGGVHQSNDLAGGLPRSPGGAGTPSAAPGTPQTGAQVHANQQKAEGGVHDANDAAGGYPKSPGGANKLAADRKMDDDTGLSNQG